MKNLYMKPKMVFQDLFSYIFLLHYDHIPKNQLAVV